MSRPLVTIVSPCYNHSKYVIESLDSIRQQTYTNLQHIIIDDCSTDDSVQKIENWIEQHNYQCTFIKHNVNQGISRTLNESISLAKGEFYTALATDDVNNPEKIELMVDYLFANTLPQMVASDCKLIDADSNTVFVNGSSSFLDYVTTGISDFDPKQDFGKYSSLLVANHIPSSILLRTAIFEKVGVFDPGLKVEDWSMWLKISKVARIGYIDQPLTNYRIHLANSIRNVATNRPSIVLTFLGEYKYARENGHMELYKKLYRRNFVLNPFKYWDLSKLYITRSRPDMYVGALINRTFERLKTSMGDRKKKK